jgi:quinol-cytochrome oxidoreductase complex cytochrome b subunit
MVVALAYAIAFGFAFLLGYSSDRVLRQDTKWWVVLVLFGFTCVMYVVMGTISDREAAVLSLAWQAVVFSAIVFIAPWLGSALRRRVNRQKVR